MRIRNNETVWIVVDPTEKIRWGQRRKSRLSDILRKTTLAKLELLIKNLELFTDPLEAEKEAKARLKARR
jgi:hypothetical protein